MDLSAIMIRNARLLFMRKDGVNLEGCDVVIEAQHIVVLGSTTTVRLIVDRPPANTVGGR